VNGLPSASEIDDAQTAHAEADTWLHVNAFVIRAAVPDDFAHAMHEREL
jgi:hypothetical protein